MKHFILRATMVIGAFALFASCTQSEDLTVTPTSGITFKSTIDTRVVGNMFEEGDQIFVQAYNSDGSENATATYSYANSVFSSTNPIYTEAGDETSYVAIYPNGSYNSISEAFAFTAPADQSTYTVYDQSSLMVATVEATSLEQPELSFNRKMSNVVFTVEGVDTDAIQLVINLRNSVTADITNDTYTATGDAVAFTPYKDGDSFCVIAAPQTVEKGELVLEIYFAGEEFLWRYSADHTLLSGYRYDYTVTVDTSSMEWSVTYEGAIADWDSNSLGSSTASTNDPYGYGDALVFDDVPTPNTTTLTIYEPSSLDTYYYPITVKGNSSTTAYASPSTSRTATRILPHMPDFTPDYSPTSYKARVNRYGSDLNGPQYEATGYFRTQKDENGRWWIIDPDGYRHIQRVANSINDSDANVEYTTYWNSIQQWLGDIRTQFEDLGLNGTGAFSTQTYQELQTFGANNPNTPLTITPSCSFMSAFRKSTYSGLDSKYPDGGDGTDDDYEAGIPFFGDWEGYMIEYLPTAIGIYEGDPNVLGFYSDNELKWNGSSLNVLDIFLALNDESNAAYVAAKEFMAENNATTATTDLREAFAGVCAEKYYSGIRAALDYHNYKILYLGTRLHGTPKQIDEVIQAAGNYCDIISINYYGNWSVANQGSYSAQSVNSFVYNSWEKANAPFMVTEFYTKATDSGLPNDDGAGWLVATDLDRACWYQHFTLGLLESTHCVGWHWFRYMDDSSANKGIYNQDYEQYEALTRWMKGINYNTYDLIDFFCAYRYGSN